MLDDEDVEFGEVVEYQLSDGTELESDLAKFDLAHFLKSRGINLRRC